MSYTTLDVERTEKRKASFYDLPPEILESIAKNLYLPDYLHFRAACWRTWSIFGCSALIHILKKIKKIWASNNNNLEIPSQATQVRECHYISRGHILSYTYKKTGSIPKDDLVQLGASLKHVPCGDLVRRAAHSQNYKVLLSWLVDHGASFREAQGGINRLCYEAYEQGDFEKYRWLFSKGASLEIMAGMVFGIPGQSRSREAHRHRLLSLRYALREGVTHSAPRTALPAERPLNRIEHLHAQYRQRQRETRSRDAIRARFVRLHEEQQSRNH
ncbi:hypothetical protein N7478_003790 [Penicillium angulare]|uniref:uncharacterized protein n=1 Tax=Penicillium angulare TaxID=116970 RepID=UPI0025410B4E|nr:uncharacterized protein N7478_003790 [Penicillium angulare]KAJ5288104.1 hypothetical protein N7478_003790 [Penicillium angulare]